MKTAAQVHLKSLPTNHLVSPFARETRKSNAALLLTLFVPVSPLLRYSYKKMGGTPLPLRSLGAGGAGLILITSLLGASNV
jgi:hypothetical protein